MKKQWSVNSKPVKLSASDKTRIIGAVHQYISSSSRLSEIVHRFEVRAGRVYLYCLHEQFGWDDPGMQFIKPLIHGKYVEFPMARITIYDVQRDRCEVNWQRHTGQWISLSEGSLIECLDCIEENDDMFH